MRYPPLLASLSVLLLLSACAAPDSSTQQSSTQQSSTPQAGAPHRATPEMSRRSRPPSLQATEAAPTFKLSTLDSKGEVDLAGFKGDKPVLLFFGSYT